MRKILAIDVGGTSSRAVILDPSGRCLSFGSAGSGNPTAAGVNAAVSQIAAAVRRAAAADPSATDRNSIVVISLAGAESPEFLRNLSARLVPLGFESDPVIEHDLLGAYFSGTINPDGLALIAGTGSVAGCISNGQLVRARGGKGWLLGDAGSGFWIGRKVVRAVVAHLDKLGPTTALTGLLLESLHIQPVSSELHPVSQELDQLESELYSIRPTDLAQFAPLAFRAVETFQDDVAHQILTDAATALANLLSATRGSDNFGHIVLGGGILGAGMKMTPAIFSDRLSAAGGGASLIPIVDGVVGTAVLGLRRMGVSVDEALFSTLRHDIAKLHEGVST